MKILMPLPQRDFDPTESAIVWKLLSAEGHALMFATPEGQAAVADPRMLDGRGLGPWSGLLRARRDACEAYAAMERDAAFQAPLPYSALDAIDDAIDALVLPGGHAPGMRALLEATPVLALTARMMAAARPVGAICHGVLVVARSVDPATGRSALHGRRTTALLGRQELAAWWMTRLWLGTYYRTYDETVQDEVTRALADAAHFVTGPPPLRRDSPEALHDGFALRDGRYVSARWPGDVHRFCATFLEVLREVDERRAQEA